MSKFRFIRSLTIKSIVSASILALTLLGLTPQPATAQTGGASATGKFEFSSGDRLTKYIEFNAATNSDGSTTGEMTFSGAAEIPDQDVEGTGRADFSGSLPNLHIEAKFDSLLVKRNMAVMSGTVTGSNLEGYIGQRVLLVVEDNGDGIKDRLQDTLTWGLYKPAAQEWIPADAELADDNGARLSWIATDAEREDDKGVPSNQSKVTSCQSFPLSSFSFVDAEQSSGNIQVRP